MVHNIWRGLYIALHAAPHLLNSVKLRMGRWQSDNFVAPFMDDVVKNKEKIAHHHLSDLYGMVYTAVIASRRSTPLMF